MAGDQPTRGAPRAAGMLSRNGDRPHARPSHVPEAKPASGVPKSSAMATAPPTATRRAEVDRREVVLLGEPDRVAHASWPSAQDVVAAEEARDRPPARRTSRREAHVVEDRQPQRLVAAARAIRRGAHHVERADAEVSVLHVAVRGRDPVGDAGAEHQMPGFGAERGIDRGRGERHVIGALARGGRQRARDDVGCEAAVGVGEEDPVARRGRGAGVARVALADPARGQRPSPR